MSPKNKKYRRPNIPAAAREAAPVTVGSTKTEPVAKPVQSNSRTAQNNPNTAIPVPTAQSFVRDLTFIGLTTLIIVILMIIAYYVVPR